MSKVKTMKRVVKANTLDTTQSLIDSAKYNFNESEKSNDIPSLTKDYLGSNKKGNNLSRLGPAAARKTGKELPALKAKPAVSPSESSLPARPVKREIPG